MDKQLYFNKLDTLRFFAFFLVIWQHAFSNSFSNISNNKIIQTVIEKITITGGIGVHIFFVISGFLITYLMIQEEKQKGKIDIIYFYIRRFLRIWPLYYLIMLLGIFILPNLFNTFIFDADVFKNLFFLNNFDNDGIHISNIGIAWSVAIEEQFYLFWPIIFTLFKNKKMLFVFSVLGFAMSTLFVIKNPDEAYFHTFGNIRFLMTGSIGAILYSKYKKDLNLMSILKPSYIYFALILIFLLVVLSPFSQTITFLSFIGLPIAYLFCVLNLVAQGSSSKTSIVSKMGKYTYGMYLYHPLIIIFIKIGFDLLGLDYQENAYINFVLSMLSLILTIVLSFLSYEYFEKYILKYKNKFSFVKTRI